MAALDAIAGELPEVAKDVRLNLQTVLKAESLTPAQRWGCAIAAAATTRDTALLEAILTDAAAEVPAAVAEDGLAAAALYAMNNVYYRFRHIAGNPVYATKPARLRMNRLAQVATTKADFELFAVVVSAINNCEACLQSHEKVVLGHGLSEDQVHDAVRIGAVVQSAAVALSFAPLAIAVRARAEAEAAAAASTGS